MLTQLILRVGFLFLLPLLLIVSCVPSSNEANEAASQSMSSGELSVQSMSSEDLARSYIEARQNYDINQIKPLLADNAKIIENGNPISIEELTSILRYLEATDLTEEIDSCGPKTDGSTNEITCSVRLRSKVSDALEIAPVPGSKFDFVISNNRISSVDLVLELGFWAPNVFNKVRGYIQQNHPESISKMLVNGGIVGISDEGIQLWKELTAEYIESLK